MMSATPNELITVGLVVMLHVFHETSAKESGRKPRLNGPITDRGFQTFNECSTSSSFLFFLSFLFSSNLSIRCPLV